MATRLPLGTLTSSAALDLGGLNGFEDDATINSMLNVDTLNPQAQQFDMAALAPKMDF